MLVTVVQTRRPCQTTNTTPLPPNPGTPSSNCTAAFGSSPHPLLVAMPHKGHTLACTTSHQGHTQQQHRINMSVDPMSSPTYHKRCQAAARSTPDRMAPGSPTGTPHPALYINTANLACKAQDPLPVAWGKPQAPYTPHPQRIMMHSKPGCPAFATRNHSRTTVSSQPQTSLCARKESYPNCQTQHKGIKDTTTQRYTQRQTKVLCS